MYQNNIYNKPEIKQRGKLKTSKIMNQKISFDKKIERKPFWITTKKPINEHVLNLKKLIRKNKLHTVCEEASCPNLGECFSNGTATFMILGDICTRRCPFCDVAHGLTSAVVTSESRSALNSLALASDAKSGIHLDSPSNTWPLLRGCPP